MNLKIIACTILTLTSTSLFGQNAGKCDIAVLSSIADRIGKLSEKEISGFLMTFGNECRNNAEFSEWSNELLFALLEKQTDLTLKMIEKQQEEIEFEEILHDLESPISDRIVVRSLIPKVQKAKINSRLKKQIVDRLKAANDKSN